MAAGGQPDFLSGGHRGIPRIFLTSLININAGAQLPISTARMKTGHGLVFPDLKMFIFLHSLHSHGHVESKLDPFSE